MKAFGDYLRRERELRGITLDELAQTTKISPVTLEALEKGHIETLPPIPFVKGFLRAYADYVGLDPNGVVLRFEAAFLAEEAEARRASRVPWQRLKRLAIATLLSVAAAGVLALLMVYRDDIRHRLHPRTPARIPTPKPLPPDPDEAQRIEKFKKDYGLKSVEDTLNNPPPEVRPDPPPGASQVPTSLFPNYRVPPGGPGDAGAGEPTPARDPRSHATPSPGPAPSPTRPDAARGSGSHVVLHATARSWVEVTVDGGGAVERTLAAGDDLELSGKRFLVRAGNGGAVQINLDGRDLGAAGEPGQFVSLELPAATGTSRPRSAP